MPRYPRDRRPAGVCSCQLRSCHACSTGTGNSPFWIAKRPGDRSEPRPEPPQRVTPDGLRRVTCLALLFFSTGSVFDRTRPTDAKRRSHTGHRRRHDHCDNPQRAGLSSNPAQHSLCASYLNLCARLSPLNAVPALPSAFGDIVNMSVAPRQSRPRINRRHPDARPQSRTAYSRI